MPNKLQVEYVPIDEIKTYPNNAKLHPAEQIEQIKESIKEFGFNDPIAIDENNVIIEGHGRLIACQELGIKEIPIIRLNELSDEQKRAYMLVHNKLTMNSDFDLELLMDELDNIADIDMSKFDFLKEDLEGVEEDEDIKPEVEFAEVLGEEHNYIVLYFDNEIDWLQAESLFDIKPVKCGSTKKDKKITKNMERIGTGRVLRGAEAINKILESR